MNDCTPTPPVSPRPSPPDVLSGVLPLSLSEHVPFAAAYVVSSLVVVAKMNR